MIDLNQSDLGGVHMKFLWNVLKKFMIFCLAVCAVAYLTDSKENNSASKPIFIPIVSPQPTPEPLTTKASIWVYDANTETPLYEVSDQADISQLSQNEYYSFVL